jgi:hypothetical protein
LYINFHASPLLKQHLNVKSTIRMRNKTDPTMGWKARKQGKRHKGKTWEEWIYDFEGKGNGMERSENCSLIP